MQTDAQHLADYRERFIAHMMRESGCPERQAVQECDSWLEVHPDIWEHRVDPENDASEAMSYWTD